jgi:hypothetical protein
MEENNSIKEQVDLLKDLDKKLNEDLIFDDINLEAALNSDSAFNDIPETPVPDVPLDPIIEERQKLKVGLDPEDIKQLYKYVSGEGEKPLFLDKFASDSEGRLKDMVLIMQLIQLARLPMLTALQTQIQERLFSPENLYSMDISDLTKATGNVTKEIEAILKTSTDAIQTITQFGTLNSEYRKLIDAILLLPEDKLNRIKEIVYTD